MITLVSLVLGALSGAEGRPVSPAGRRLTAWLHPGRSRRSGADIVTALIRKILEDPDQPLPRCQNEVNEMVTVLRAQLPALALAAGRPRRPAILGTPAPTDHMGSRIHLILLAETAQHLVAAARPEARITTDHPPIGASASSRQNTPVNAVGLRPPWGSEPFPEGARCRLVTAASGSAERGAAP
ncbi:hypothetical protein AB9Q10_19325 [Streptomyces krungchingensis]|uniref:hypothetical protein n=1 Tax=Streptomyces krungchingensis TaxID=1565034 RepID=UPI003CEFB626